MRPFGEAKSISSHLTLQLMRRHIEWSKGKRVCISRPVGKTDETWKGYLIGSQRIHSTCSPADFIFIIFESRGKGFPFCNGKKWS
ncbi:hypothetical protein PHAVU_011G104800 [Phaseolus vulgaris]|uniref:Uncharacterized protein n=1 Tax=Phaseolus vulgaris TaxID=3885 RepID=V7AG12_PHAVU|nr:hypothetical protein PHAVU_011G104800g [Phaseolus vulgaris]ESW04552.1 hypothetical protein PHAVU_011G104800g [Phaseolus vulgaris]